MLSAESVRRLLEPFAVELPDAQLDQLVTYLELLMRWNQRINLTSVRTPEECVTRHFGESLYLARFLELRGRLLDIGSGAGFPGLALKIPFPELAITLLEPAAKKRAFLKEVVRACGWHGVEVRAERLEEFVQREDHLPFDAATARAVGGTARLVARVARLLEVHGRLCLWLGYDQGLEVMQSSKLFSWASPISLPGGERREILVGTITGPR